MKNAIFTFARCRVCRRGTTGTVTMLALCWLVVLTLFPFHDLDMALARIIWRAHGNAWSEAWLWAGPAYTWAKVLTAGIGLGLAAAAVVFRRNGRNDLSEAAAGALATLVLSTAAVWALKETSGVACPWSLAEFGSAGAAATADPFAWISGGMAPQGRCWPAGHAGTGFGLFRLYFAARRVCPRHAGRVLALVAAWGWLCAAARMLQGAHFLSHSLATMLLDWVIAAAVFACLPARGNVPGSGPEPAGGAGGLHGTGVMPAAVMSGAVLTAMAVPFFTRAQAAGTVPAAWMAAGLAGLLFLLYTGLFLIFVRLMPARGWRVALLLLGTVGGVSIAFEIGYGTVMTADMIRNALATDRHEAAELIGPRLIWTGTLFSLPAWVVALATPGVRTQPLVLWALAGRTAAAMLVLGAVIAVIGGQMGTAAAFFRTDKQARYFIVPPAVLYSFARTLSKDDSPDKTRRVRIDSNPSLVDGSGRTGRPLIVAVLVGETARIANWGLAGYVRNTTPELAGRNVVAFNRVTACGTSTDVSLPCMFSRVAAPSTTASASSLRKASSR